MNKQESQNLMIGSWVLAEGKPRQVHSLTTKKAGFKRGTNGQRDFFRFDQLQGIPLSEPLLKECVTYRPTGKQQDTDPTISIHCYSDTVIAVRIDGNTNTTASATCTKSSPSSSPPTNSKCSSMWRSIRK